MLLGVAKVVGIGGLNEYAIRAEVVLPVAIVVNCQEKLAVCAGLGCPGAAEEEDFAVGAVAADEGAEGVAIDEIGLVIGAGFLQAIRVGGPAIGLPAEAGEAGGGGSCFGGGAEKDGGVEVLNLRAVTEGVDVDAAGDLFLTDGEDADVLPGGGAELERFDFGAEGFAVCEADEAELTIELIGVAGHDAFEEAVEGTGFVLVGVLIGFEERGDDGDADGGKRFDGGVGGFTVCALEGGDAGGDLVGFGGGGGVTIVDGEDVGEGDGAGFAVDGDLEGGYRDGGFGGCAVLGLDPDGGIFCEEGEGDEGRYEEGSDAHDLSILESLRQLWDIHGVLF